MIPSLRSRFNAVWTPAHYQRFLQILEQRFGEPAPFRLSETPVFLSADLVDQAARAGAELVTQLLANSEYLAASEAAVPELYKTPNDPGRPLFIQADFGLTSEHHLKLVEIQGFPSLYAYQPALSEAYREAHHLTDDLASFPDNLSASTYAKLLKKAIVSECDPENVVLLEIDPTHQKTRHDFSATSQLLGVEAIDARSVIKQQNRLFYRRGDTLVPIYRIYNRVIADELDRRQIQLPFSFRDDLQVEWAGHPNWFFRLSKFSLPYLKHPTAPPAYFLDQAPPMPDLQDWVLKPLYSFAGSGVILSPTSDDLADIPADMRSQYLLQQRVAFVPVIETLEGPTKIEIRVMYIWLDHLQPVNLIIRMGRGSQMGVDHNKGLGWVGASAAFIHSGD